MTVLTDDLAKFEKSVVDDRQAAVADFIEHIQSDDFYPSSVKVTETNEFHSTQEVSSSVELESESATERYIDYFDADEEAAKKKSESAAEKIVEEFPEMQQTLPIPEPRPMHKPKEFLKTYSFASLINESDLLQRLVELGVDLSAIERKQGAADLILKLDYDKHIKPILQFLVSIGIPTGEIGAFLTKNPWILQESIDDLKARINYLKAKNFSDDSIARIATKGIFWLNIPVKGIDQRLGFLQREFGLSGDEIRLIVTKAPKLITFGIGYLQVGLGLDLKLGIVPFVINLIELFFKMLRFTFHEELGFSTDEMKDLLIKEPKLWLRSKRVFESHLDKGAIGEPL